MHGTPLVVTGAGRRCTPETARSWRAGPWEWTDENNDTNQLQKLDVIHSTAAITYTAAYGYNSRGQLISDTRSNGYYVIDGDGY